MFKDQNTIYLIYGGRGAGKTYLNNIYKKIVSQKITSMSLITEQIKTQSMTDVLRLFNTVKGLNDMVIIFDEKISIEVVAEYILNEKVIEISKLATNKQIGFRPSHINKYGMVQYLVIGRFMIIKSISNKVNPE